MERILLLPGDGQGPEMVAAAGLVIGAATDQVELVHGDLGFSAYEKYGEPLPYETLDLVGKCRVAISGRTSVYGEGDSARSPLDVLMSQMDFFAKSRTFRSLADDIGTPGIDATVWGSNMNPETDISETPEVDGITISKYVRSDFYSRMMGAALTDMELRGKTRAVCIAKDDLFPQTSGMFYEAFDALFAAEGRDTRHCNVVKWLERAVSDPADYEFLVVADLYSSVVESIFAGRTGGDFLAPTRYVGEDSVLILPGIRDGPDGANEDMSPASAVVSAAMALAEVGLREEGEAVLRALRAAVADGERASDLGGTLSAGEFADAVVSRL
ncbi:MAG: isocitrate/isopropylmalate family dehydrogenase [Thermoplasmata archaeon]|nr:isocitrate/isopropylmalate family dehydrogenase [Thermoplasmata archaeon]